ncbi:hypothetical protein [Chryseomicrobium excrementi]|uniref:hypothetical protein n=1 Tax=Chryseomicrobium excrementi TaxID=2041346 RepID=UPI0013FE4746|nr:hypothetical protein [Chryseomicrobium excrementi]
MKQFIVWLIVLILLFITAFVYNEQIGAIPLLILAFFLFAVWFYIMKSKKRTKR